MALGGKVDDVVEIVLLEQALHQFLVADVALHEHMAGVTLHVLQVFQVAGVGQLIQVDQQDLRVFLEHIMHKVGTNKTGAAGDQIGFHKFISSKFRCSKPLSVIAARCQLPRKGELFSAFPPDA